MESTRSSRDTTTRIRSKSRACVQRRAGFTTPKLSPIETTMRDFKRRTRFSSPRSRTYSVSAMEIEKWMSRAAIMSSPPSIRRICCPKRSLRSLRLGSCCFLTSLNCIRKELSKDAADRYITLSPELMGSDSVQLLFNANLLQRDKTDACRVRLVDFSC